jgi:stage V sporulation protein B
MNKIHGVLVVGVANGLFIVVGYLTNIWLGRHLGPGLYGIYGILTALMTAMNIMQVSGVPQAVSKFVAEKKEMADAILISGLQIQLITTFSATFIIFVSAPLIANIFNDARFIGYSRIMSLIFPFYGIFALYSGYYNGLHKFKRQALLQTVYSISKLFLVIGLSLVYSIYGIIVGFILSPIIALLFGVKIPHTSKIFSRRRIIVYSVPLIGFAILMTLLLSVDLFSLKAISTNSNLAGYYTAAQSIAIIIYFGMSAIGQILFPSISSFMSNGNIEEARRIISKSLRYLLLITIPLGTLMYVTAPNLIKLLYGNKYLPATQPLRILLGSYILLTIFSMLASILNGASRANYSLLITLAGTIISFVTCVILIPSKAMLGAAIGTLIGSITVSGVSILTTYKIFRFNFNLLSLLKIFIGSTVIFIIASFLDTTPALLPVLYLLCGVIYISTLYLLREFNEEDFIRVKSLLPPFLRRRHS